MADTKEGNSGDAEIAGNRAVKRRKTGTIFFGRNMHMENRPTRRSERN
jgi:hypothetical protein